MFNRWQQWAASARLRKLTQIEKRVGIKSAPQGTKDLQSLLTFLKSSDDNLTASAFGSIAAVVQTQPSLQVLLKSQRLLIEATMLRHFGFAEALRSQQVTGMPVAVDELVTLGAKVGAGTGGKQISPVTSDSARLASWIISNRGPRSRELQVSVGYDLGLFPAQRQRSKFIALYLYIATTDLQNFQSLLPRPRRDHGAAYGMLIRGEVVEVLFPGQSSGRRMDYIFSIHPHLPEDRLRTVVRQIQMLNLGLMLAALLDTYQAFFPGELPPWFTPQQHGMAECYRQFEHGLVRLLREYDHHRHADLIHPLDVEDHQQRRQAFSTFRLEECLYPHREWLAPLYGDNLHWDHLLPALRVVEGMLLHQGAVSGKEVTRGNQFIRDTRLLGYETVEQLEAILSQQPWSAPPPLSRDPFLDEDNPQATKLYLADIMHRLQKEELHSKSLMDVALFQRLHDELNLHADTTSS